MTFLFSFFALLAGATSFNDVPFDQTIGEAEAIVRGTAGDAKVDWGLTLGGQKKIYTFTEVLVSEVLKGDLGGEKKIRVRQLGGEKDGVGLSVPGTAQFAMNEETVLFLTRKQPDGSYDVAGMMMGKYNLSNEGGEEMLTGGRIDQVAHAGHTDEAGNQHPKARWSLRRLRDYVQKLERKSPLPTATATLTQKNELPVSASTPLANSRTTTDKTKPAESQDPVNDAGDSSFPWPKFTLGFLLFAIFTFFILKSFKGRK